MKIIKGFKKVLNEIRVLYLTSFLVALLLIAPISNFLLEGVQYLFSGNFSLGIAGGVEILSTLKVLVLTTFFGGGLGTLNGWLLSNCEFKFRKALRICQLIPLAAPAYLITAVLQDLGSIFGYQITGLWWGITILSISTYPYAFILANESFNKFGINQIYASRGLGVGPWESFFKVALPMAIPALVTGISLMCMEVMNELGTFELLNIPSISTGITENWIIDGDPKSAFGLSLVALLIIFTLIIFEKFSRSRSKRWSENPASQDSQGWELKNFRAFLAIIISMFPPIFSLGIPCFWIFLNIDQVQKGFSLELLTLASRTIGLGLITALITMLLGLFLSLASRQNKGILLKSATSLAGIGYAIPGTVIALSLINISSSDLKFISICFLIWGYLVRFLTISKGSIDSSLERISPNLDEAANGLGANWLSILRRIHMPLLKGPIFVGSLLVFVDTIKELPITFILRPFDFDTLSVRIYQYAGDERMVEAILPTIFVMILGLIASITLVPTLEKKN